MGKSRNWIRSKKRSATHFEKGNAEDRAFREKVYRSAFAALERATQSQPQLTVESAIRRRQNLPLRVRSIKNPNICRLLRLFPVHPGEIPPISLDTDQAAAPAPAVDAPAADGEAGAAPSVALDRDPELSGRSRGADFGAGPAPEPELAGMPDTTTVAPDRDDRRAVKRRRPLAAMFAIVTLLSAAAIGGWWAYDLGLFKLPSAPPPAPPEIVEEEAFDPGRRNAGGTGRTRHAGTAQLDHRFLAGRRLGGERTDWRDG